MLLLVNKEYKDSPSRLTPTCTEYRHSTGPRNEVDSEWEDPGPRSDWYDRYWKNTGTVFVFFRSPLYDLESPEEVWIPVLREL